MQPFHRVPEERMVQVLDLAQRVHNGDRSAEAAYALVSDYELAYSLRVRDQRAAAQATTAAGSQRPAAVAGDDAHDVRGLSRLQRALAGQENRPDQPGRRSVDADTDTDTGRGWNRIARFLDRRGG